MPAKTKKEKLLAQLRRQQKLLELNQSVEPIFTPTKYIPKENLPKKVQTPQTSTVDTAEKSTVSFFFQDLKKSLVFIGVVIALEFFLYFASIK
jgi:hypothetical protein